MRSLRESWFAGPPAISCSRFAKGAHHARLEFRNLTLPVTGSKVRRKCRFYPT